MGDIRTTTVKNYFRNTDKNGCFIEYAQANRIKAECRKKRAWDDPAFRKWFDQELNLEIDPTTLTKRDQKTKIKYIGSDGQIYQLSVFSFFAIKARNDGKFVIDHKVMDPNFNTSLPASLKEVPGFLAILDPIANPAIDINAPITNYKKMRLYKALDDGTIEYCPVYTIVKALLTNTSIPWKRSSRVILSGVNDVTVFDPDIELYWGENKRELRKIGPNSGRQYNFICPYCGYKFKKAMKNIALSEIKCPQCRDTGFCEDEIESDMKVGFIYLVHDFSNIWDDCYEED